MRLSVIVPVYNVEKFLPRCLDSLMRQNLKEDDYEVICVDDGSTDRSPDILDNYEHLYPNVICVITQKNKGVGEARNQGLKKACGEYVAFVDSDDYIIDGAYHYILGNFCQDDVDVVHYGCLSIYTNGRDLYDAGAIPDGIVTFDGKGSKVYNKMSLPGVALQFYKRSFLEENDVEFRTDYAEDELFNFDVFRKDPHLRMVSSNIYRYEQGNVHSLMTTVDKSKVKIQLQTLLSVILVMNNYLLSGESLVASGAQHNINKFLGTYYNKMLKVHLSWREWKVLTRKLREMHVHNICVSLENNMMGKIIAVLKNCSGSSYIMYVFVGFFFRVFFKKIVRPIIVESNSKIKRR